jgi:biotin carboxylase
LKINSLDEADSKTSGLDYPLIVKPTRAASSVQVSLVQSSDEMLSRLAEIGELANSRRGNYYENKSTTFALVEEFLPGNEVTLDGVVVAGRFILGGIHNKKRMSGPYFEEDLYSLPFRYPELEEKLSNIASDICEKLGLVNSLFNVELRQDGYGEYKVVEFSPRISGGHVYRNIRDVYGIDLVAIHLSSLDSTLDAYTSHSATRSKPRMSTCIKFIYRNGHVLANDAGAFASSNRFGAYYPLALPGSDVRSAPCGFNITGLLSIIGPYRNEDDIDAIENDAISAASQIHLLVEEVDQ